MERPDNGLYFDVAVEPQEGGHGGFEVSISCDDPTLFDEGVVAQADQAMPWLIARIEKLIRKRVGR